MGRYQELLEEARKKTTQRQEDRTLLGGVQDGLERLKVDLTSVELVQERQLTALLLALFSEMRLNVEISKVKVLTGESVSLIMVGNPMGIQFYIVAAVSYGNIKISYCQVTKENVETKL
ncbi:MAG: hypothetical protein Q8N84_00315 [bacterium]|nr:hypothetical protein [bacterium]